jgi:hypothetical protein
VEDKANLLQGAVAAVIPEEPLLAVVDGVRPVTGVMIPLIFTRADNWVGGMAFPAGDAVGAGRVTDGGMVFGLAGVPKVVTVLTLQDHGVVDVILPPGLLPRTEDDLVREMEANGFQLAAEHTFLEYQYFLVFKVK